MSLTRVAVIGGPEGGGGNGWDDHARAAAELRSVLTDQGIAIAGPGDPADGIIALPGGRVSLGDLLVGCLEGSSADDKPCGLLNTGNYFSDLLKATEDRVVELFARNRSGAGSW